MTNGKPGAPGPGFFGGLGVLKRFRENPLEEIPRIHGNWGDIVRLPLGPILMNLVLKPEYIQHFLVKHHHRYKLSVMYEAMKPLLGRGLLTSDGEHWLRQRRTIQPEFRRDKIARLSGLFAREAGLTADYIAAEAEAGRPVEMSRTMMHLTFQIIGQALVGGDLSRYADMIYDQLEISSAEMVNRASAPLRLPMSWPTPRNLRFRRANTVIQKIIGDILLERNAIRPEDRPRDFLTTLMESKDPEGTGAPMSPELIRDEAITFLSAGHETTANALAWTFYLLSQHPQYAERLREECRTVLGDRPPAAEDLARLPFAEWIIKESMRIFPPVWFISRQAAEEDEIGGYYIKPGSVVATSQWFVHRHPDLWEEPEKFDPERFSPERSRDRDRHAFFPFSAGQKMCIGEHFAMLEAQIVLITLIQRFRFRLVPNHPVEPEPLVTLRPKSGLPMIAEKVL